MIVFKEDTHQYFNTDNNHEYMSATKFLHLFEQPFDPSGSILKKCAERQGITPEELQEKWKKISTDACNYGTMIHALMENHIKHIGEFPEEYITLKKSFDRLVGRTIDNCLTVHSEKLLWNHDYEIAGTADLLIEHNENEFSVGDFKTNKKFEFYSSFGNRMKNPVSHLSQCHYSLYGLQLSLYAYFFSLISGKDVRSLFLLYKTVDENKNPVWEKIPVQYMKMEVISMLETYKKDKNLLLFEHN